MSVNEKMTAIAAAIRDKTGNTEKLSLDEMATSVNGVYDAGKQKQWSDFWDALQKNGKLTYYRCSFYGSGWHSDTFYPKYDITGYTGHGTFSNFALDYPTALDLVQRLEDCGVTLDTSKATIMSETFYGAGFSRIPAVSCVSATSLSNVFSYCSAKTIEKLILKADGTNTFTNVFVSCSKLQDITIEGVIGNNGFNMSACTQLSKASITSVVNALSTAKNGLTVTLSLAAVNKAFETSEGANDGEASMDWVQLEATKINWNISLV